MNSSSNTTFQGYGLDIQTKDAYSLSLLKKGKLEDITKSVTTTERLDSQVETYLIEMADGFIDNVLEYSCIYAKHRGNETVSSDDVTLSMAKVFNVQNIGKNKAFFNNLKSMDINKSMTADHKKRLELTKEDNKNTME